MRSYSHAEIQNSAIFQVRPTIRLVTRKEAITFLLTRVKLRKLELFKIFESDPVFFNDRKKPRNK